MIEIKYPFFKKDRILKIEMLENIRDFPRDILDIYNENLSDGIVCGFIPSVDKEIITFSKGITKYNGSLYLLSKSISVSYCETESDTMIKINFYDETQDSDYKTTYIEIEIDDNINILDNQQELGRFKLKRGAFLRSNYQDLYDFTTEYNTINIVNVKYAGYKESTLNPLILKYFAEESFKYKIQNNIDLSFCMLCMNNEKIERKVIYNYISYRLDEDINSLTNIEIHNNLVKILNKIKSESKSINRKNKSSNKIMLD